MWIYEVRSNFSHLQPQLSSMSSHCLDTSSQLTVQGIQRLRFQNPNSPILISPCLPHLIINTQMYRSMPLNYASSSSPPAILGSPPRSPFPIPIPVIS